MWLLPGVEQVEYAPKVPRARAQEELSARAQLAQLGKQLAGDCDEGADFDARHDLGVAARLDGLAPPRPAVRLAEDRRGRHRVVGLEDCPGAPDGWRPDRGQARNRSQQGAAPPMTTSNLESASRLLAESKLRLAELDVALDSLTCAEAGTTPC